MDNLDLIDQRLKRLEGLVGNFENLDQTKGLDTLLAVSSKLKSVLTSNPKLALSTRIASDIDKFMGYDIINEIEDENSLNVKIDLILLEEDNIRKLNEEFTKIKNLSKILDDKAFNDLPILTEKLKEISAKQASIKQSEEEFSEDLRQFLAMYYKTMKSVNETISGLNQYLDQFDKTSKNSEDEEESFESD